MQSPAVLNTHTFHRPAFPIAQRTNAQCSATTPPFFPFHFRKSIFAPGKLPKNFGNISVQALTFHQDIVKILTMEKIHINLIFKQEGKQL